MTSSISHISGGSWFSHNVIFVFDITKVTKPGEQSPKNDLAQWQSTRKRGRRFESANRSSLVNYP